MARLRMRIRSSPWQAWLVVVAGLAVVARLALPHFIQGYLNRLLARQPTYQGEVGDVGVSLYRGAYEIHDVDIRRRGTQSPVPFVAAPLIDVSLQWGALLHGSVVGKLELDRPELNFVGGDPSERQTGTQGDWWHLVGKLFPVGLNRLEVRNGTLRFRNFHAKPPVNIRMEHLDLVAENLQNSRRSKEAHPPSIEMRGLFPHAGGMVMHATLDPEAHAPDFAADLVLHSVSLPDLNDFLRAYAKLDANQGRIDLYAELRADRGSFEGYAKPFLRDVSVLDWSQNVTKENVLSTAWRAFAQGVLELFKNRQVGDVATRIPLRGTAKNPQGEFWPSLGNAFWNAFIQALAPRLERGVRDGAAR